MGFDQDKLAILDAHYLHSALGSIIAHPYNPIAIGLMFYIFRNISRPTEIPSHLHL
jgi:hypothetical protein